MARVVVSGFIIRYPLGGNIWAHLQYVVGLARLGHDVWFMEEAGWEASCYDPSHDVMTADPGYGSRVLTGLLARFGLADRWAYRELDGSWWGPAADMAVDIIGEADLFLNVGGTSYVPEMRHARRRAYVDMDPVFTQLQAFGASPNLAEYDVLFSYGTRIGRDGCSSPTLDLLWRPLRPPVVLDLWKPSSFPDADAPWTTIAHWTAYGACEFGGEVYGQKDVEFMRLVDLPRRTPSRLQVAVASEDIPLSFAQSGWELADPLSISLDAWEYREYIWGSRGEFSVAKEAYVKTCCGWFSDRTATYLAAGRPAVVQDTGICADLPTGSGLQVFRTIEEAVAALRDAEDQYEAHCRDARAIAETYFDSDKVLAGLLNECRL
jgi:hypothetical protein